MVYILCDDITSLQQKYPLTSYGFIITDTTMFGVNVIRRLILQLCVASWISKSLHINPAECMEQQRSITPFSKPTAFFLHASPSLRPLTCDVNQVTGEVVRNGAACNLTIYVKPRSIHELLFKMCIIMIPYSTFTLK